MAGSQGLRGLVGVLIVLATAGCTNDWSVQQKQAPENMLESFSAPQTPETIDAVNAAQTSAVLESCAKAACITIQKKAFGKVFLLLASGITGGSAPQWYDLKPLVVSFEKNNSEVALLGQNYNSIYKEIKSVSLIQTFKIVAEDATSVTFDWGKGLNRFVVQSPYDVDAPRGGKGDMTETSVTSIPVMDSFTQGIRFDEKNIELTQTSKIRSVESQIVGEGKLANTEKEETLVMNIQIRSYNLSGEFRAKEFDKSRRVGFFVTKVSKSDLSQDISKLITKWDLAPSKGPITVRITKAVPDKYLQAVVEAVAYWNKVFGKEVLVAKAGVDVDAGPEDRSIIIRWVPWLDAGAAYALGQSDPLTGEVLRAQVFMPAAFTKVGSASLVQFNDRSPVLGNNAIACDFSESIQKLDALLVNEKSDSQRLRLAQDSVRATVAHELGHALGLRHNFAGSFSSKVSTDEVLNSVKTYFKDPQHQGLATSTSIMDYVGGVDEVLMSARIKVEALPYDKMAMKWAYSTDDKDLDESVSKYCTDDDIGLADSQGLEIYGCQRFDAGNNPLRRKFVDAVSEKDNLVNVLFASILGRLFPVDGTDVSIDKVLGDTQKWGSVNLESLNFVANLLMDRTKDGAPFPAFASIENVKSGNILYSRFGVDESLSKQRIVAMKEIGGYSDLVAGLALNSQGVIDFTWFLKQIEELKTSGILEKGTTLAGRDYQLTAEQQKKILEFYQSFGVANLKAFLKGILTFVPKINAVSPDQEGVKHVYSSFLAPQIVSSHDADVLTGILANIVLINSQEKQVRVGPGLNRTAKLLIRALSIEERLKYLPWMSKTAMRADLQQHKDFLHGIVFKDVAAFVQQIDPAIDVNLMNSEALGKLSAGLATQGLVDVTGASWLASEIKLILALDILQ